jgi:oligopeptide transport system ATP-binding protein
VGAVPDRRRVERHAGDEKQRIEVQPRGAVAVELFESEAEVGTARTSERGTRAIDQAHPVLEIEDLRTYFHTQAGVVKAVDGVSLTLHRGETLAVVGESGSGKSVTFRSILGLIPRPPGRIESGSARLEGMDLLTLPERRLRQVRGDRIGLIVQDAFTALSPLFTIGYQIANVVRAHEDVGKAEASRRALEALDAVHIPRPDRQFHAYPRELSGGMQQRVLIAMALMSRPDILIADEPTTALDVTIEAQILELLDELRRELGMSMILITHDLGVVARYAQTVAIMYAGKIVELGDVRTLFYEPRHPYTRALLESLPRPGAGDRQRLRPIRGQPPNLSDPPSGCAFHPRCDFRRGRDICVAHIPELRGHANAQRVACHFADEVGRHRAS